MLRGTDVGMSLARETRQRVLDAAERLGYVPDPVATRLASAGNAMLGLYTFSATFPTDVAHSYYPILVGVEEEAAAQGQDLILFTGSSRTGAGAGDPASVRRVRAADGCLFFGRHVPEEPVRRLLEDGFPSSTSGAGTSRASPTSAPTTCRPRPTCWPARRRRAREHPLPARGGRGAVLRRPGGGVLRGARASGAGTAGLVVRTDGTDLDALLAAWLAEGVTAVVVEQTDTGAALAGLGAAIERAGLSCPRDLSLAVLGAPVGARGRAPAGERCSAASTCRCGRWGAPPSGSCCS
ncbi:LacI family transcriptional regulator [Nocardiopsis composta]